MRKANLNSKLIVFDLDNTLTKENVSFSFGKYLFQCGFFGIGRMLLLFTCFFLHRIHLLSVNQLHALSFRFLFYKVSLQKIEQLVQTFVESHFQQLARPSVQAILEEAKKANSTIWIQSSSPSFLVNAFAEKFGVHTVFATTYTIDCEGIFEAVFEVMNGEKKAYYLLEYMQKNDLSVDDIICCSDSILDLPLLLAAGRPIAVCPDRRLRAIALKNEWEIIQK